MEEQELHDGSGRKVWLEAALNGPWGPAKQPGIPVSIDGIIEEGVACAHAGAAIIHVHAYDVITGRQKDDWETYARIITGIRSRADAIVYPTIPFGGEGAITGTDGGRARFGHLEELARRGLLEWAAIDPGSTNITHWDQINRDEPGFVYTNPEQQVRHALGLARQYRFHPAYAIYEPGFLRLGAALHWRCGSPSPVYRFMFTSDYSFGFPPEDFALTAYLHLLDRLAPGAQWMLGGLGVDVLPLVPRTVMEGGHVRVGLEDQPFGCERSNAELVEAAADAIGRMGGALARAEDVRSTLNPQE
ncbi:MAG: 3-keto-5-aminohexanoate cleavage protein [Betaproteobacteria bacterium]|nr:3-keto-5-aminohexanoate cleavage protein [Betaproteobacteria bacterium]